MVLCALAHPAQVRISIKIMFLGFCVADFFCKRQNTALSILYRRYIEDSPVFGSIPRRTYPWWCDVFLCKADGTRWRRTMYSKIWLLVVNTYHLCGCGELAFSRLAIAVIICTHFWSGAIPIPFGSRIWGFGVSHTIFEIMCIWGWGRPTNANCPTLGGARRFVRVRTIMGAFCVCDGLSRPIELAFWIKMNEWKIMKIDVAETKRKSCWRRSKMREKKKWERKTKQPKPSYWMKCDLL